MKPLTIIVRQEAKLEFFGRIQNVNHLLEVLLEMQRLFEPVASVAEELKEVIPEPEDVLFPEKIKSIDTFHTQNCQDSTPSSVRSDLRGVLNQLTSKHH